MVMDTNRSAIFILCRTVLAPGEPSPLHALIVSVKNLPLENNSTGTVKTSPGPVKIQWLIKTGTFCIRIAPPEKIVGEMEKKESMTGNKEKKKMV